MHTVGIINRDIYKCITEDIVTDEVIITDVQIRHIQQRHPNDYERFASHFEEIVKEPDFIIETKKPNTALILKEIRDENEVFKTVLRLVTSNDNPEYKNSIITFMKIDEKEWKRLLILRLYPDNYLRWKISHGPHADGTDRGNPRDAGEACACQMIIWFSKYRLPIPPVSNVRWYFCVHLKVV